MFEGVEGTGKSTQVRALGRQLLKSGLPFVLTKEPGGTMVGLAARRLLKHRTEIRISPTTELLLFSAARAQLVDEVIRPALDRQSIVICDRYAESTLAYQGYGRGLDLHTIRSINDIATRGLRPDIIFLLDLDVREGLGRKGVNGGKDRFEREDLAFHRRVREGYLEMARTDPKRWLVIDATLPKNTIRRLVWQRVEQALPRGSSS